MDNHPIELWSNKVIDEKIDYVYNNPVEAGLVFRAENLYSSAADYANVTRYNRAEAGIKYYHGGRCFSGKIFSEICLKTIGL